MKPKPLDLSYLKKFCDDDQAFIQEMLETLLEKIPEELMQLKNSVKKKDAKAAYQAIHKLKSSLHLAGLPHVQSEMKELEKRTQTSIQSQQTLNMIHSLIVTTEDAIVQLRLLSQ